MADLGSGAYHKGEKEPQTPPWPGPKFTFSQQVRSCAQSPMLYWSYFSYRLDSHGHDTDCYIASLNTWLVLNTAADAK